jgi:peptidoglycan/xylan/chitin deacetylase (PgdA/CDA1 family)
MRNGVVIPLGLRTRLIFLLSICVLAAAGSAEARHEPKLAEKAVVRVAYRSEQEVEGLFRKLAWRSPTQQKVIALTLDDGPDPKYTPTVLALARSKGVKLTFFLVGRQVQLYPDLARQEAADGHAIGDHTWDHHVMTGLSRRQDRSEIERCGDEIAQVCGERTHLFRPPKGRWNDDTLSAATSLGYHLVLWSVALEHHPSRTPEAMAQRVIGLARPGMIILAHDGEPGHPIDRSKTLKALSILIDGLQRKGYRFVTLPELLAMEKEQR